MVVGELAHPTLVNPSPRPPDSGNHHFKLTTRNPHMCALFGEAYRYGGRERMPMSSPTR